MKFRWLYRLFLCSRGKHEWQITGPDIEREDGVTLRPVKCVYCGKEEQHIISGWARLLERVFLPALEKAAMQEHPMLRHFRQKAEQDVDRMIGISATARGVDL